MYHHDDTISYTAGSEGRVSGTLWEFDAYYMNQDDKYYVEENNDFNLKYQMEFHASRDLELNSVEIRIPVGLLTYRDGTSITPTEIALPQGTPDSPVSSNATAFNYYIDDDTGEIVFFNYKKIESGSNMVWQVLYKNLDTIKIADETSWTLTPTIEVKISDSITESGTAKALEGLVDTSVTLQSVSKEVLKIAGKSYGPELYTEKQVEEYISGELPDWCSGDNFNDYVYIVWDVKATGSGNQPWSMELKDINKIGTSKKGSVVGYKNASGNKYDIYEENDISKSSTYTSTIIEKSSSENFQVRLYVVSAYPKSFATEGKKLTNTVDITLTPLDGKDDAQTKSDSAEWSHSDYEWNYVGDTIGINKGGADIQKGALKVYETAKKNEEDKVKLTYTSVSECYGYSFTHNINGDDIGKYIDGTFYTVSTFDDILYVYPTGSKDIQMLGKEDYYFTNVVITQTDKGYDVWEDEYAAPEKVDTVDQNITIYAMYEDSEEWQEVATVPWSDNGIMTYTFTADQLARKPWRVRADHTSVNYLTTCKINVEVCLRHNSPIIEAILEDNNSLEQLTIQNLSGVTGKTNEEVYFHDDKAGYDNNYQQYPDNLQEVSQELYDTLPMRDDAETKITELTTQAASYKTSKSSNDAVNGRVNVVYTITAYDGYEIQNKEYMDYLSDNDFESPGRNEVVFYDLLPYGVKFDPSKPVTAGRITDLSSNTYRTQYKSWNKGQVKVTVDTKKDVIDNYKDTGRTMVIFHISYSGEDSATYSNSLWFEGWGVNFSTYYEWKDIEIVKKGTNISAFMPELEDTEPLLGSDNVVSKDDGTKGGVYEDFGSDINNDEETNILNVLYADNNDWEDVITAASSEIKKLVKADNDTFGIFKQEATVEYDSGYTYEITLNNTDGELKDIVIYDRLENASVDRDLYDSMEFEDNSWHGMFDSVVTKGLEQLGIAPVIYYNANRDASITTGSQQPSEVLTKENGWYRADEWTQSPSDVKAIAVDISEKTDGTEFILEEGKSVSFQIKMTAPTADDPQLTSETKYTYNNTAYYSYNQDNKDINIEANATVISNSTRVKLNAKDNLAVEKEFDGAVSNEVKNNSFEFYLYQESDWNDKKTTEKINFANKEYKLYVKDENSEWKQSEGLYATDANGILTLHAGEKAVFENLPDASSIIVEEEENIFWESTIITTTEATTDKVKTVTHTATNKYRPILYLQKQLKSVPSELEVSDYEFTFRIFANGEALANAEFWYVDEALTNGGIPNKIGTGITDENGYVTIKPGEVIAVSPGDVGTEYKVVEILDENSLWICENEDNTVDGTVALNGSLATITNVYRLKDLYITKEITHQDASKCTQEFTFKITDSKDNDVVGNEWVLLDSDGNETTTKGTLNENGEFTVACAGQTVKVEGFKANETYIIEETVSGDLYKPMNGGIAEVTMPLYSLSANVTITNDYLKRPLSVSKIVMYNMEDTTEAAVVAEKEFTMTVTVNGELIGNYPYTVVDSYGNTDTGITDENGQFKIKNGETVTFEDVGMYGDGFTVTETEDSDYPQIYPAEKAPQTGTLLQDENKVTFINGSGNNMIISKQYVGNDDTSTQYISANADDLSVNITLKYKDSYGAIKVWPETDTTVQVIDTDGESNSEIWAANSQFTIPANGMVIISENSNPPTGTYYVSESEENQHKICRYDTADSESGTTVTHYLEISQKIPANDGSVTGTVASNPVATIVNEVVEISVGSEIEKHMSVGSYDVPDGAKLIWRVERYTDGKWQPAENIRYMISNTDSDGTEVFSNGTLYTGSDGIIELEKQTDCGYPTVKFIGEQVYINVQTPQNNQLRVVELQDESDEAWGMLVGYGKADNLLFSTNLDTDEAVAFVNSNLNTPVEIEKVMETDCDETFAMTLRQVISSTTKEIAKTEDITETVIRVGIPYIVYDSETGEKLSESVTDKYGNIYLKAGQFARLELTDSTVWTVSEEINPQYKLKNLSSSLDEKDDRLTMLDSNLMLIKQQYPFIIEDIEITAEMVEEGYVYNAETGEKVILNEGDVDIPEYIILDNKKYRVTSIGVFAFSDCEDLTKITIPSSVTSIGNNAFDGCTNLTEVTIPDSVTSIASSAFQYCENLNNITIPNSVTSIGKKAFYYSGLTEIEIPSGVTSIGDYAFQYCTDLTEVTISGDIETFGESVFDNCPLTTVIIKEGVTIIADGAFSGCTSLTAITISSSVTTIGSSAFAGCSSLEEITIPNGVTSIGEYAFSGCAKLTAITIPSSVETIGENAFLNCRLTININKAANSISGSPWGATRFGTTVNWKG